MCRAARLRGSGISSRFGCSAVALCELLALVFLAVEARTAAGAAIEGVHRRLLQSQSPPPVRPQLPTLRTYFIAAELISWEYVPTKSNLCAVNASLAASRSVHISSASYIKAVFRAYTDDTFQVPLVRSEDEVHLGILGPVIRAEVGDDISVVLRNKLPFTVNIEPSGVSYSAPLAALPNTTVQYLWAARVQSGPNMEQAEKSSKLWLYRSTVDVAAHIQAGLWGPLVVTARGSAKPDGKPVDVDKEFIVTLQSFDEKATPTELQEANNAVIAAAEDEAVFHSVNGWLWCNLKGLVAEYGSRVRWHIAAMGGENSRHNMHWHGISLDYEGRHLDAINLVPGSTRTLDATMDNPGTWLIHCHVNGHLASGMDLTYTISGEQQIFTRTGRIRNYFIAAEMVEWDYAPLGGGYCSGHIEEFTEDARVFLEKGPHRIGSKYLKALYVEYTDSNFTRRKPRPTRLRHMGFLGPVIRAEVGDVISVLFKNKLPSGSVSLHPHGVLYDKGGEGAPYNDNSTVKGDDAVPPGGTWRYTWNVPPRAGPGPSDNTSVMWMYHSHTDEVSNTQAGLMGPMIIGAKGLLRANGVPRDVNTEFFLHFSVLNENENMLFERNVNKYLNITDRAAVEELRQDEEFQESNLMHSINGYMYCNIPFFTMRQNETARFYVMALGDEVDIHTPFSFSTRWYSQGRKREALRVMPGTMVMADVQPDRTGLFGIKCKVDDHLKAGMDALLNVTDPLPPPTSLSGVLRRKYISADLVVWDYAPLGRDACEETAFTPEQQLFTAESAETLGSKYLKAVYREYTDWTFQTLAPQPDYQGILGPTLHAEPGDTLSIVLRNNLGAEHGFPVNLHPAGGLVLTGSIATKGTENITELPRLNTITADLLEGIPPGEMGIYEWYVPENAGPGPEDSQTAVAYTYLSTVDEVPHSHAGLMGVVLVTTVGGLLSDSQVAGVDQELPVLMTVINEQASPLLQANIARNADIAADLGDFDADKDDFIASNQKHSINGYLYCNQPVPVMVENSTVMVVMVSLGSEDGLHGAVFAGQTLEIGNRATLAPQLLPSITEVAVMRPQGLGVWKYHCGVANHYATGMVAKLRVTVPRLAFAQY